MYTLIADSILSQIKMLQVYQIFGLGKLANSLITDIGFIKG